MAKTSKKTSPPPPQVVYLRMDPADYEIILEMKKEFYEATVNQAVIKGLHSWKENRERIKNLEVELMDLRNERNRYRDAIKDVSESYLRTISIVELYQNLL